MNILFFSSIAEPEIKFYNQLYHYFKSNGLNCFYVFFDCHNADLRGLNNPDFINLKSYNLNKIHSPYIFSKRKAGLLDSALLEQLFRQEQDIYGKNIKKGRFMRRTDNLAHFIIDLLKILEPYMIICNYISRPAARIVEAIIRKQQVPILFYNRFAFSETYQFSEFKTWNSRWLVYEKNNSLNTSEETRQITTKILEEGTLKYHSQDTPYIHDKPYLLLLTGNAKDVGFGINSSDEYITVGSRWGDDMQVLKELFPIINNLWPDCDLLIRQHPFTKPKLSKKDILHPNIYLVPDKSLHDLVENAQGVICSQTTLIYHVLRRGKALAVLGHHELEQSGILTCCHDLVSFSNWLRNLKKDRGFRHVDKNRIIEEVNRYFKNCCISLDYPETFNILDKFIAGVNPGKHSYPIPAWRFLKRRQVVYSLLFGIKNILFNKRCFGKEFFARIKKYIDYSSVVINLLFKLAKKRFIFGLKVRRIMKVPYKPVLDSSPIIIGSYPRSGSSMVMGMISASKECFMLEETGVIFRDLQNPILRMLLEKKYNKYIDTTNFTRRKEVIQKDRIARGIAKERNGADNWGDKTTVNCLYIPFIYKCFPKAKIVLVNRNPLDSISSWREHPRFIREGIMDEGYFYGGRPKGEKKRTLIWRDLLECISRYRFEHAVMIDYARKYNLYWIKYEDILKNPEYEIKKLFEYLELNFSESVLQEQVKYQPWANPGVVSDPKMLRGINRSNIGVYRDRLTRDEALLVYALTKDIAAKEGYDLNDFGYFNDQVSRYHYRKIHPDKMNN